MSKKHGARKKRRRKPAPIRCPSCHSPADASLPALLAALAACLNSARDAGVRVKVRHGVIIADGRREGGYVLQSGRDDRWRPVTLPSHPDVPPPDEPGDGLDD